MDFPPISHRTLLADGSVRVTASKTRLEPLLFLFLVLPVLMLDLSGFGYAGVLGAIIFGAAILLFAACLIIWPRKNTFLFDITQRELRVAYVRGRESAWSVPFSDITRVWLAHERPPAFERFTVMVTTRDKTYSLFRVQGFSLASTLLDEVRHLLPDSDV